MKKRPPYLDLMFGLIVLGLAISGAYWVGRQHPRVFRHEGSRMQESSPAKVQFWSVENLRMVRPIPRAGERPSARGPRIILFSLLGIGFIWGGSRLLRWRRDASRRRRETG